MEPKRLRGRYVIDAALGKGGMGTVYRVVDEASGERVALKRMTLPADRARDSTAAKLRFRREFHTMARLRHPRIVRVFDYGVDDDGVPYYTMELLDGSDLAEHDRVPAARACELLRDVATALAFLHARRLLHRDLAPRNVRCTSDGRASLIDFGVLATIGISGDVAGTPPFMAPEAIRGRPLDHRYDLYGLGALAYRILTGRHAYPARTIEQLEPAWRTKPPPPSELAADIPPALDELVLALLAHDPLARPAGAAEVIDRLSAIGGLARPPEIETTHGWLASAALVGRQREMQQLKRAVARAVTGDGRSVLIEAPSGIGKSRLLHELALEAQLAAMCVVRVDSDGAGRGPYGIFHELARGLVAAAPDEALAAARPRGPMLARVITELRDRLGVAPARPAGDPTEDRARMQSELAAWVLDIAQRRPLALLVDDIQRCDEASAALLAALAHQAAGHALLVAAALRTDETTRAAAAVASLADAGQRLRLRGLDEDELGELCRSLFGDVPHVSRLARRMHELAAGSPLHATELARHLVDRGVIRYADGLWSIPEDVGQEDLPRGLADAMDARVRALPAAARALGEALSVHRDELPLQLIVRLADTDDEAAVFAALDQLAFEEVLIQSGDRWQFRHDGLREALLRGIGDDRRRALHLRVGEELARSADAADLDGEIGWHLLHGGDVTGGAARLERAGRALYDAQSFADCVAPLEAALTALEQRRGSQRARMELLHMLVMAGCMADRACVFRHAGACVTGYRYWSGIDVATRLRPVLGKHLAVMLGLAWAFVRWLFHPRRGPNPYSAFLTFFIIMGYCTSIHAVSYDLPACKALVKLLEPVAILKNRIPYAACLLIENIYNFPHGDFAVAKRAAHRVVEIVTSDRLTPIRDIDRKVGEGAAHVILGLLATLNLEPEREAELAALEGFGLAFYDVAADQSRVLYHRFRGEEEQAVAIEAKLEMRFVQLGPVWMMQAFVPALSAVAFGLTRDTLGLRRMIEELATQCAHGMVYDDYLHLARGEYLRERGDAAAAQVELAAVRFDDNPLLAWATLPAQAETALVLGDAAGARALAERGLAIATAPETFSVHAKARSIRVLALIDLAAGDHTAAAARLDAELAAVAPLGSPLLTGTLHEARARVALAAGDTGAFHTHAGATLDSFRATRNPALIARADRLAGSVHGPAAALAGDGGDLATASVLAGGDEPATAADSPRAGLRGKPSRSLAVDAVTSAPPSDARTRVSGVLSGCRGSAERATRALELIVAESRAASGYLYLRRGDNLELVAPTWGVEPPAELVRALGAAIGFTDDTIADRMPGGLRWKPLGLERAGALVGGIAVVAGGLPLIDPERALLDEIARELFEAGDVSSAAG